MNHSKLARVLPFVAALGGLCLAPALARADVVDCYAPTVAITSPANGTSFEGVSEVPVTTMVTAEGFDAELTRVYVLVDGVEAAAMDISTSGAHQLMVPVGEGSHQLVAGATDACAGDGASEAITIEVTAPTGASTGEPETGDDEMGNGSEADGGDEGDEGGSGSNSSSCAVDRVPSRSWVGLSAFLLAVLGAWRLRRSEP
jgi:hypothetical protein